MRRACVSTVRSPLAHSFPFTQGVQHRQPVARRPCGHEQSETPTRTRPKLTLN
ncbi:MAG: hypothetical protein NZ455_06985 [Bacteroidia bacterium]|nr:hypothetical protein [Bacteroidia bacterium]MDW8347666.1 hypothetical protein [Bacteroidia bacterium]